MELFSNDLLYITLPNIILPMASLSTVTAILNFEAATSK